MAKHKSVLDMLKHSNRRPHTLSEIISLVSKNQASVSREIRWLIKTDQIERHEIKLPQCTKLIVFALKKT